MLQEILATTVKLAQKYGHLYIDGAKTTLQMSLIAVLIGTLLGALISIMKMSKLRIGRLRIFSAIATLYIEIIRGTPLMVQMYFFYYGLPMLIPKLDTSPLVSIIIALILNSAAYMSEIIRSGIEAVDSGQTEAARSLGMTSGQTMWRIILPQAVKNILPAMCNEFVMIIKETAIVATFFGGDIMTAVNTVKGLTYLAIEPLLIAAVTYFVITFTLSKLIAVFERRLKASD